MDPVNNDENKKRGVGSFVASGQSSDGAADNSSNGEKSLLEERLAAMSRSIEQEKDVVRREGSDAQPTMSTTSTDSTQFPQEPSLVTQNNNDGSSASTPAAQPSPTEEEGAYHTISGKPETLRETVHRNPIVTAPITPEAQRYPLQVDNPGLQPKGASLFAIILKFFFVIDCIVFLISYKMSAIVTFLSEGQYIKKGEDGLYSYGQTVIPKLVTDNALYIAIGVTVVSLVALLVAGAIDIISRNTTRLPIKFLVFAVVIIIIGLGVYVLSENDFNVPLLINAILAS